VPYRKDVAGEAVVAQAYNFFAGRVQSLLSGQRREAWPAIFSRLVSVLADGLYAVMINLGPGDDPLIVFERLNANRLALQASDFIRNHLFAVAETGGLPADWLYDHYWSRFDSDYWRSPLSRTGRPRIDDFLTHFLVLERKRPFGTSRLLEEFNIYLLNTQLPLEDVITRFATYGDVYRRLEDGTGLTDDEAEFAQRLRVLDIFSLTPVVLRVLASPDRDDRRETLRVLESYVIRRMIVGAPTGDYTSLAANLARELDGAQRLEPAVRKYLSARTAKANSWPDDAEVIRTLTRTPIATTLERPRLRLILKVIEQRLRNGWSEPIRFDADELTVEHLLPVAWADHWEVEKDDRSVLNEIVHTLGNLTLITKELNDTLGTRPWEQKRKALHALSALRINHQLDETWNAQAIRRRGARLATVLCGALPPPERAGALAESTVDADADKATLAFAFEVEMNQLYERLKDELDYDAHALFDLIRHAGGVGAARQLLSEAQPGAATRFALGRSRGDLTVEALVGRSLFSSLFSEPERTVAAKRLAEEGQPT
jgi:hypothetical protein